MSPIENLSSRAGSKPSGLTGRLSVGPQALFVYGSLTFPEVLRAVIGRVPTLEPAVVTGWRRVALSGRPYPALVPGDGEVKGYRIPDLRAEEWRAVDAFEDPVYAFTRLDLDAGRTGWAYTCEASEEGTSEWDIGHFHAELLTDYLTRCANWRTRYDGRL